MKKIIAIVLGLIFIFTLSEISFRVFSLVRDHSPSVLGLKNSKSLLIIGNSYTVGPLVSPKEIYSKKVENEIGHLYNVINISDFSLNTALIKEKLSSVVKLNPKIVFLMIGQPNHWNYYGYNNFHKQISKEKNHQNFLLSTLSKYSRSFAFLSYALYRIKKSISLPKKIALSDPNFAHYFINKISNGEGKLKENYLSLVSSEELVAFFDCTKKYLEKNPGNINFRQNRIMLSANLNYPLKFIIEDLNQLTCYGNCFNELAENALLYYSQQQHLQNSSLFSSHNNFFNVYKINPKNSIFLQRRHRGNYSNGETPLGSNSFSSNQKVLNKNLSREEKWINYLLSQTNNLKSSNPLQKLLDLRDSMELTSTLKGFDANEPFIKDKKNLVELFAHQLNFIDRPRLYLIGANALFQIGENDLACFTLYKAYEEYPFNFIYSFKEVLSTQYYLCSKQMQKSINQKMIALKQNGISDEFSPFLTPSLKEIQRWRYSDITFIVKFFNSIGAKVVLQTYLPYRDKNEERDENMPIRLIAGKLNIDLIDHFSEMIKMYPNINDRDKIYLQGRLKGTADDHFSPEGHQLVANAILNYLKINNFIQSAP
jgi:hypothetical protein